MNRFHTALSGPDHTFIRVLSVPLRRCLSIFSGKTDDARSDRLSSSEVLKYCIEVRKHINNIKTECHANKQTIFLPSALLSLTTHFHLRAKCRSELLQDGQAEGESILLWVGGENTSTVVVIFHSCQTQQSRRNVS